jgi:hypothetical protein
MRLNKWDVLIFVGAFVAAQLLLKLYEPLAFILLGAAFILFAPFVVVERFGIPFIQNRPRLAVVFGLVFVTLGGLCWLLSFRLALNL